MIATDIRTHMLETYKSLRWSMAGVAAVFLISLTLYKAFGGDPQKDDRNSISAYYHHTNQDLPMQVLFAGTFAAIGLLLIAYQGYTDLENWVLNVSGVALLGVLLFPMDWPVDPFVPRSVQEKIHVACALVFFAGIAYVCLFRARDTLDPRLLGPDAVGPTTVDRQGNDRRVRKYKRLYYLTGVLMVCVPLVWLGLYLGGVQAHVYIVEFFGVLVFLSYWVIKNFELGSIELEKPNRIERLEAKAQAVQSRPAAGDAEKRGP